MESDEILVLRSTSPGEDTVKGHKTRSEVMVVVPKSVLLKESQVFRAMLSNTWSSSNAHGENIRQHVGTKGSARDNTAEIGAKIEDTITDIHSTNIINSNLVNKHDKDEEEVEEEENTSSASILDISGFNNMSVKVLFEYVQGYTAMMKSRLDFDVLVDMLRLCDFYDMTRFVPAIAAKLKEVKIDEGNVLHVLATLELITNIDSVKTLSEEIKEKCAIFARESLPIGNKTIGFMLKNRDNMDELLKLLEAVLKLPESEYPGYSFPQPGRCSSPRPFHAQSKKT